MGIQCHKLNNLTKLNKNSDIVKLGKFIDNTIAEKDTIIVLGVDWSSEVNYYAKRKGIAMPDWATDKQMYEILNSPLKFMGNSPVGALIAVQLGSDRCRKFENKFITKYRPKKFRTIGKYNIYYDFSNDLRD